MKVGCVSHSLSHQNWDNVPQETAIVNDISLGGQKTFMAIRLKKGSCLSFNIQLFLGSRPNQCVKSSHRQSCKRTLNPKFLWEAGWHFIYTLSKRVTQHFFMLQATFCLPHFLPVATPPTQWIGSLLSKTGSAVSTIWMSDRTSDHTLQLRGDSHGAKKWEYICKAGNEFKFHTKLESKMQPKLNPKLRLRL